MTDLTAIVWRVLEKYPQTRNSDTLLFLKVLQEICEENGKDLHTITVADFAKMQHDSIFPKIQTIKRVRRMIRAKSPEL